jgi:hypothetical protein
VAIIAEKKSSLYPLSIVSIVAIVAITVLVLEGTPDSTMLPTMGEADLAGMAIGDIGMWDNRTRLCDNDLYHGHNVSGCDDGVTDEDLRILAGDIYVDFTGATRNRVGYTQKILFENEGTGQLIFTQDDDDAPDADLYLFIDNSNNYLFTYQLDFEDLVYYDDTSVETAEDDIVGTEITILGKTYTFTDLSLNGDGSLESITLEDSRGKELFLLDDEEIEEDGTDIDGSHVVLDSAAGDLESLSISYAPDIDEVYLSEGEQFEEPIFGLTFTYASTENDDYEEIAFVVGSTSGEIRFANIDGTAVELPIAADSSATAGEASNEPVYWGGGAPTSTDAALDELVYLEGEACVGDSSIVDCQGGYFLVVEHGKAHFVQITNIDTSDNEMNFDDLTYDTSDDVVSYIDDSSSLTGSNITLTEAGPIGLVVNEVGSYIKFVRTGSDHGATIVTENRGKLSIVNTDKHEQIFEGLLFAEFDDSAIRYDGAISSYLEEMHIQIAYDDVTDNKMEIESSTVSVLDSSDGRGLFDLSDTDDDTILFMSYKGTRIEFDREDQSFLSIYHPLETIYGQITIG